MKMSSYYCLNCNKLSLSSHRKLNKYCSNQCQQNHRHAKIVFKWLHDGEKIDVRSIKRYLRENIEYRCSECGLSDTYNNKPITLELEHKDGDSENNNLENLCWLCPNCHSQTSTYKSKNNGNGRHSRMKRYYEGKSY